MSACSAKEDEEWTNYLKDRVTLETKDYHDGRVSHGTMFSSLQLDLKPLGPGFRNPSGMARRMSVYRAATLGPKAGMHQVIIKNTHTQKEHNAASDSELPVMRSQSHMSSNNVPTLAPRRAERIRLETAISDVWSKDILPYPGMASRRPENPIRASANSVMRKLSMASIATNFSRRSTSHTSLSSHRMDDSRLSSQRSIQSIPSKRSASAQKKRTPVPVPVPVVDFHNAPDAFLPEDFELPCTVKPESKRRRGATMTIVNEYQPLISSRKGSPSPGIGFSRRPKTPAQQPENKPKVSESHSRTAPSSSEPKSPRIPERGSSSNAQAASLVRSSSEKARKPSHLNRGPSGSPSPSLSAAGTPQKRPTKAKSLFFRFFGNQ
jgi:hypothetical protein